MKMFSIIILFFFGFSLVFCQSIEFSREITIKEKPTIRKKLSSFFFGKKNFQIQPAGVTVLNNNDIALTDTLNKLVIFVSEKGEIQDIITGLGHISFASPVGICSDKTGAVFVSDSARMGIVKISSDRKSISLFAATDNCRPVGMTLAGDRLFCVDSKNHRVLVFNLSGEMIKTFGSRGKRDGEFNFPTHIASDGLFLYVVDAMNFRIQVFDMNGHMIRQWGSHGDTGGMFSKPKAVAVDRKKHVFVSDVMFDNIQIFSDIGEFLYVIGEPGHNKGQFWMPSGLAIDMNNNLLIADTYNKRIQSYKINEVSH